MEVKFAARQALRGLCEQRRAVWNAQKYHQRLHVSLEAPLMDLINPSPVVHERKETHRAASTRDSGDEGQREPIDALEIFEHLRDVTDPEHPYSLEQLNVVSEDLITVEDSAGRVRVQFTPTVQHCSMATLIGLSLRVKLMQTLPSRFKVDIFVTPGTHSTEAAVNKQLNDKERVAAALENPNLVDMVNHCLASSHR